MNEHNFSPNSFQIQNTGLGRLFNNFWGDFFQCFQNPLSNSTTEQDLEIGNSTTKVECLKLLKNKATKMSRTVIVYFEIVYKIIFRCHIKEHHVYKIICFFEENEKLHRKK